ncbi:hypothetical protein C8Q73DRAFT_89178 [Cubamyces lactineus]|nr:hypothetical protein C8Q73DRAFT_89178 [Cubamyces lactineus]
MFSWPFYACAPRVTGLPNLALGSAVTHPRGRVSEVRVLRRRVERSSGSTVVTATHPPPSQLAMRLRNAGGRSRRLSGRQAAVYGKRF